ncbi:MAG: glycosyltransferase [Planctomycetia bacterium]|nr:glycosyltransferase [Planctomycetia bacterium]
MCTWNAQLGESAAPTAHPARRPLVSVIVPVRNEERFIGRTLDALLAQEFPEDASEILVVDGQSTDRTVHVVRQYAADHARIRLLDNPKQWSSAARNLAIAASHGAFILVVDGHCELTDRNYLKKLVDAFTRSGADCVGRPQPLDVSGATPLQRAIAAARNSPLGHHPDSYIYSQTGGIVPAHSVAVAYRREVFDKVGVFDERFDACEDVELNHRIDRAGLRCFLSPDIALNYVPRGTLRALFRQLARYGKGRVRLARKHPDTISLSTFLPVMLVLALLAAPGIGWLVPFGPAITLALAGTYAVAVLAGSGMAMAQCDSPRALAWIPLVFPTIHVGAGCGMLYELFFPRRTAAHVPLNRCTPVYQKD